MLLRDYVMKFAERGACTCGKCIDAPENPEKNQPTEHTVNLTFFQVKSNGGDKDEFLSIVKSEFPHWLDGKEHNYIQMGGDIGDQTIALMRIGLGHLLGAWEALSPDTIIPFLDEEFKKQMADMGMVAMKYIMK